MRDLQLFSLEVRRGGRVVRTEADVLPLRLGDALRDRVREIVARPSRVGWSPAKDRGVVADWREVRLHHHLEFSAKVDVPLFRDRRNRVALSYGIAEVAAEALFAPVYAFLLVFNDRLRRVAKLSAPVEVDFWAPRRKRC